MEVFGGGTPPLTVSQLTEYIRTMLEADPVLGDVWVSGEATNVTRSVAGHVYFSLRDAKAQVKCVLFRSQAQRQLYLPSNGDAVLVHGAISVYPVQGAYQLYVDDVRPLGDGELRVLFQLLYEKLEREGLFDQSRKRALPRYPRCIAVITSPTGAVWHDIQTVLRRRYPLAHLLLVPAVVQGDDAPAAIQAALEVVNQDGRADVVIIARGGGSFEDLWCFNHEDLVRAVYRSRIPVISAVGHETDYTLCDFVADLRAPTPSAAAELVAPDVRELKARVHDLASMLQLQARTRVQERRDQVDRLRARLGHASPRRRVDQERLAVTALEGRMRRQMERLLQAHRARLTSLQRELSLLHPQAPLQRGYALVLDAATGRRQRQARALVVGQRLRLEFTDGSATSRVIGVETREALGGSDGR